jgi:hypothetical protein
MKQMNNNNIRSREKNHKKNVFCFFLLMKLCDVIVIYIISGIKAILQDSSVKIADDEGVSPS